MNLWIVLACLLLVLLGALSVWLLYRSVVSPDERGAHYYEERLVLQVSWEGFAGVCLRALERALPGAEVQTNAVVKERGLIVARTPRTLNSWGEIVEVALQRIGEQEVEVVVGSSCRAMDAPSDQGRNRINVALLVQALRHAGKDLGVEEERPAVEAVLVPRVTGASRCPYCREQVAAEHVVACVACVARHHAACWDEHGACATCGSNERFTGSERTAGHERERPPEPPKERA